MSALKPSVYLITYGNEKFYNSKKRLQNEANSTGWFDNITIYGPEDLDNDFREKNKNILNQNRGNGYWMWKSYIIKKHLDKINENDILIYLDTGCCINPKGKNRFDEYIEMLNKTDTSCISFQMNHLEKVWSIKEIFQYFNIDVDGEIANSGQIIGGVQIIKKNYKSINMVNQWVETISNNPLLFTDHYNSNQESYFIDNRHDQSIFSIIRKMNNTILLNDETYFTPFGSDESLKYPFWTSRIRD